MEPFEPEVGSTFTSDSVMAGGSVTVMSAVFKAAFASLTVIVYGPAVRFGNTFESWNDRPSFE